MGDQGFVARGLDLEMQMCGAPGVPGSGFQQLPNRTIVRDGVGHGQNGMEVKAPLRIRCEYPSGLVLRPFGVLHVVQAFVIGLPNLDPCMGHRFAVHPFDAASNQAGLPLRPVGDILVQVAMGRILHMVGSLHGCLGTDGRGPSAVR